MAWSLLLCSKVVPWSALCLATTDLNLREPEMDYVKPADVAATMMNTGRTKLTLSPLDLVIRGGLAGAILAAATSLAFTATVQTGQPLVGALVFPVGLILIVLLGLDLVTGSFGLLPLPWIE